MGGSQSLTIKYTNIVIVRGWPGGYCSEKHNLHNVAHALAESIWRCFIHDNNEPSQCPFQNEELLLVQVNSVVKVMVQMVKTIEL